MELPMQCCLFGAGLLIFVGGHKSQHKIWKSFCTGAVILLATSLTIIGVTGFWFGYVIVPMTEIWGHSGQTLTHVGKIGKRGNMYKYSCEIFENKSEFDQF